MSRMTKYLHQRCSLKKFLRNGAGEPILDKFGEFSYGDAVTLSCRRQSSSKIVQTANGSILRVSALYFVDEKVVVEVDDRIDGKDVVVVDEYTNEVGKCEGFECYV